MPYRAEERSKPYPSPARSPAWLWPLGVVEVPPPSPDIEAFASLVAALPANPKPPPTRFVKKIDKIPKVVVQQDARSLALKFSEKHLIG